MYEKSEITESKFAKLKRIMTIESTSWVVFGLIIVGGIIARIFLWDFTSSDIFIWKEAAEIFLSGENPYEVTLESFQIEGMTHFYAYLPLWMYICSAVLLLFPESWFFIVIKGLVLLFDLGVVAGMYFILRSKVDDSWRLKLPIAFWFVTPMVIMTSAMHGKFDSLLLLFLLLACIYNEKNNPILESLFLTFAILTKPIALIFVPFFYRKEIMKKDFGTILSKGLISLGLLLVFSIPFLSEPILYFKGVLGVHITRGHDLGPIFGLLKLIFRSPQADPIIRICLTVIIIVVWLTIVALAFIKKYDIYTCCFLVFLGFNGLYWVFLIQYTVWIYTFYVIVSTKSKLAHWKVAIATGAIVTISVVIMSLLGLFTKNGL